MHWEVQHSTLCEGWVNTWAVLEGDAEFGTPQVFDSCEAAAQELAEFFADIQADIDAGEREAEDGYDEEEFRIVRINDDGTREVEYQRINSVDESEGF